MLKNGIIDILQKIFLNHPLLEYILIDVKIKLIFKNLN